MLDIAKENNLAETAFCVKREPTATDSESADADAFYDIRKLKPYICSDRDQNSEIFYLETMFHKYVKLPYCRWFTCEIEMDLCGHATLAAAHVIFNFYEPV